MATDPVCGMQVDEKTAKNSGVFEGKSYFFCSAGCKKKFEATPSTYLNKPPAAGQAAVVAHAAPSGAVYTCPMHPEIVRNAPGDCPLCGMALVPVAGTGEADDSELRGLKRRLWIGSALSIPLFALAMAPMIGIHD